MAPFQVPLAGSQPESNLTLPWIHPGQQQQRMMHKAHYWEYARTQQGMAKRRGDATDAGRALTQPHRLDASLGRREESFIPWKYLLRPAMLKQGEPCRRQHSRGRGDSAALCRAAVQSIVQRSHSPGYCGASLDSACTAERENKRGNKQAASSARSRRNL